MRSSERRLIRVSVALLGTSLALLALVVRPWARASRDPFAARAAAAVLDSLRRAHAARPYALSFPDLLDGATVERMRSEGFRDPIGDLKRDLMRHREFLPFSGEFLGSSMDFYSATEITVLDSCRVFAAFNDGHVVGGMLLRWSARKGRIHWAPRGAFMI
jgi:hypothetical protein